MERGQALDFFARYLQYSTASKDNTIFLNMRLFPDHLKPEFESLAQQASDTLGFKDAQAFLIRGTPKGFGFLLIDECPENRKILQEISEQRMQAHSYSFGR